MADESESVFGIAIRDIGRLRRLPRSSVVMASARSSLALRSLDTSVAVAMRTASAARACAGALSIAARGTRADVDQARADPVGPPRSSAARVDVGARRAARQHAGRRVGADPVGRRSGARQVDRAGLRELRPHPAGDGIDRADAPRDHARRRARGRQGTASEHRGCHAWRSRLAVHRRARARVDDRGVQLYHLREIVAEFERGLLRELDYGNERENLETAGRLLDPERPVVVPRPYPATPRARRC